MATKYNSFIQSCVNPLLGFNTVLSIFQVKEREVRGVKSDAQLTRVMNPSDEIIKMTNRQTSF